MKGVLPCSGHRAFIPHASSLFRRHSADGSYAERSQVSAHALILAPKARSRARTPFAATRPPRLQSRPMRKRFIKTDAWIELLVNEVRK